VPYVNTRQAFPIATGATNLFNRLPQHFPAFRFIEKMPPPEGHHRDDMRFPHPALKHRAIIGSPSGTLFPGGLRPGGAIENSPPF
jgi:hypothetical protein